MSFGAPTIHVLLGVHLNGIARSQVLSVLGFNGYKQFAQSYVSVYPPTAVGDIPVAPHPHQHVVSSFSFSDFIGRAVISPGDFKLCLFTCVWLFGILFGEVVFQAFWPFPTAFLIDL